jgi:hypothetical protein
MMLATAVTLLSASAITGGCEGAGGGLDSGVGGVDGSPASPTATRCPPLTGLYMDSWTVRNGTCRAGPDGIVNFFTHPAAWAGTMPDHCSGDITPSADYCEYTFDVTCTDPTLVYMQRGKSRWTSDLARATAIIFETSSSKYTGVCSGTFDATWTKL